MQSQSTFAYTAKDYERMARHLDKRGDCWLYIGQPSQDYAQFKVWCRGKTRIRRVQAHVAAFEMEHGPVPDGMFVCHRCDTPRCCRARCTVPGCEHHKHSLNCTSHLYLGTPKENAVDRDEKGRHSNGPPHAARGEAVPNHKLTNEIVRSIRAEYAAGGVTQWGLARRYGVKQAIISAIVRREAWKHVT